MVRSPNKLIARWAAEILVIALGIILAISAESLWQDRSNRQEEVKYLIALSEDFSESLELLEDRVSRQDDSTKACLSLLDGKAQIAEPIQVREWIRVCLYFGAYYEPQLNALKDLEQSGKMDLLQNANLRRKLASLLQKFGHFEIFLSSYVRTQENLIDSYLVDHFDLVSILNIDSQTVEDQSVPLAIDPTIFNEIDMRSRIALKLSLRRAMQRHQADLRTQFEELIEKIQSQLE